jgi:hypothetical protein
MKSDLQGKKLGQNNKILLTQFPNMLCRTPTELNRKPETHELA